jgi:hypothetical protein
MLPKQIPLQQFIGTFYFTEVHFSTLKQADYALFSENPRG